MGISFVDEARFDFDNDSFFAKSRSSLASSKSSSSLYLTPRESWSSNRSFGGSSATGGSFQERRRSSYASSRSSKASSTSLLKRNSSYDIQMKRLSAVSSRNSLSSNSPLVGIKKKNKLINNLIQSVKAEYKASRAIFSAGTQSIKLASKLPAVKAIKQIVRGAGKIVGHVMSKIIPVLAVADIGYTLFLLGKGIATNNFNDVVEHITGLSVDQWKEGAVALTKVHETLPQGVYDTFHMDEYYKRIGSKVPTCKMCPPGTALYWNGTECVVNPCEKRNGVWGVYDPKTNTCSYSGSSETPDVGILPIDKPDLIDARVEQNEALKFFWAVREQWWQESNTQEGDGIILINQKAEIRKKGAEVLARECP